MVVPTSTMLPASSLAETTQPAASEPSLTTVKQVAFRPLVASSCTALSWVWPMMSGISIIWGPRLTTRLTVSPFWMTSPASGDCRMMRPFSTVSLYSSVT